jgi:uncharacterized protein (TIGR02679 family)
LGGDRLAALRRRLRRHFERLSPGRADVIRVAELLPEEHEALASLTGRSARLTGSLRIDVGAVDLALRRAGIANSLRAALEVLDGPIVNAAAVRAEQDRLWADVVGRCRHCGLSQYLRSPAAIGLLKRLSGGDPDRAARLCARVEAVLQRLPAKGLTRAQLAAEALGDPHALDSGQAAATLGVAVLRQEPMERTAQAKPCDVGETGEEQRAEKVRDIWARAGVLVNELARPALVLNLPTSQGTSHPAGEPGYLSLRLLLRTPPVWAVAGLAVYVCENPNLLAIAADRLGPRCRPLVCTDWMPAAAQDRLLTQLAQAGACLHYHGDFDWPGLRIGNHVMREWAARPWRFAVADYVDAALISPRPGRPLDGAPAAASWDAGLALAMQGHQLSISEESVAETLLRDLESAPAIPDDGASGPYGKELTPRPAETSG